jgi:carbon storage regulator
MLLLDRRYGESIIIGDNIRVTIFQRPGNKVCVGVLAPRDVPVNREEVLKRLVPPPVPSDDSRRGTRRLRSLRRRTKT